MGEIAPPAIEEVTYTTEEGETVIEEIAPLPEAFKGRFMKTDLGLSAYEAKEKGPGTWTPITSSIPEVIAYYQDYDTKQWMVEIKVLVKPGVTKTGTIDAKVLGQGGSQLLGALASNLFVSVLPGKARLMETYMHTWVEDIKRSQAETAMFSHMGWYDDGSFLYGDKQYLPDGSVKVIKLKSDLHLLADSMAPVGSLDRYKQLIGKAYNHPNHEEFQFTWLSEIGRASCRERV